MKQYYYSDGQNQFGPFTKEELRGQKITKETLVWCEGMSDWVKAGDVDDLADLFFQISMPPPLPGQNEIHVTQHTDIENKGKIFKRKAFFIGGGIGAIFVIIVVAILGHMSWENFFCLLTIPIILALAFGFNKRFIGIIISVIIVLIFGGKVIYEGKILDSDYPSNNISLFESGAQPKTDLLLHTTINSATKVRSNSAILNATLESKSDDVISYSFEYTQHGYSKTIDAQLDGDKITAKVGDLYPNTDYEFCLVEKQNGGTIKTSTLSFTTLQTPVEINAKVTTHSGRLLAALSSYNAKKKKIISACNFRSNTVRSKAAEIASQSDGNFNIGQVCDIFDYCYDNWKYVNDPNRGDLYQKASNTISNGLTGDCDDFAILMASMMLAIGGDARVNVAYTSDSGHAYTELNIGKDINEIANYIRARYGFSGSVWYRTDSKKNCWLNLDWQAQHPGGEYYGGKRGARIYIIDEFLEEFSYK